MARAPAVFWRAVALALCGRRAVARRVRAGQRLAGNRAMHAAPRTAHEVTQEARAARRTARTRAPAAGSGTPAGLAHAPRPSQQPAAAQALRALARAHAAGLSWAGDLRPDHVLMAPGGRVRLAGMRCVLPPGRPAPPAAAPARPDTGTLPAGGAARGAHDAWGPAGGAQRASSSNGAEASADDGPAGSGGGSDPDDGGGGEATCSQHKDATSAPGWEPGAPATELTGSCASAPAWLGAGRCTEAGPQAGGQALGGPSLRALTAAWRAWRLSTFEYLLHLNRLAGRRWGDPCFHPIMPWVLDMSAPPEPTMHVAPQARRAPAPHPCILHVSWARDTCWSGHGPTCASSHAVCTHIGRAAAGARLAKEAAIS